MKRETVLHCWEPRHSAQIDFQGEDLHMTCSCGFAGACEVGIFDAYSWDAPSSCDGQEDGLRWIKPDVDRALQVFCQSDWVLMQKRTGPSVNFYRNWMSYARGFGDSGNF